MVGMDVFATEARIGNITAEVIMDDITKDLPQVPVAGVPPILVLNVQLPAASPNVMTNAMDGPGYQVRRSRSTAKGFYTLRDRVRGPECVLALQTGGVSTPLVAYLDFCVQSLSCDPVARDEEQ